MGLRKTLLGGLGRYEGLVVEVLTMEEWEALISDLKGGLPEFAVSFALDGEDISWSMEICTACDALNYDQRRNRNVTRCNPQFVRADV